MSVLGRRCGAAVVGLMIDRALGEPPNRLHPVAWFGTAMGRVEQLLWRDERGAGAAYTATGVAIGAATGAVLLPTSLAVALCVAGRQLRTVAASIGDLLDAGDLAGARDKLPWLVGRDPSHLDESGVSAAVVESLAENSVDAVIAPVFWALVAGAPGVAGYRAVNTMDAMVGHRNERYEAFGWSAARLDDVANWIPARLFGALVAGCAPSRAATVATLVRRDARAHPSPNAGVAETSVAAALGVELGGPLRYGEVAQNRPRLGDGPRPNAAQIPEAITLVNRVELLVAALLGAVWMLDRLRQSVAR